MKKKIIITGGLGYIGTELCKLYSGNSWHHSIKVIDNKFMSERVNQLRNWNIEFVHGDIFYFVYHHRMQPPYTTTVYYHRILPSYTFTYWGIW